MTAQEKIQEIMNDASERIMQVLSEGNSTVNKQIEDNLSKIMQDSFEAKTLLIDENTIDKERYSFLDFIPDESIEALYYSCKYWATTGELNENSEYKRFCANMASLSGTTLEEELEKNIDIIVFKNKQINGNNTRLTD